MMDGFLELLKKVADNRFLRKTYADKKMIGTGTAGDAFRKDAGDLMCDPAQKFVSVCKAIALIEILKVQEVKKNDRGRFVLCIRNSTQERKEPR